jgi:gluconolactonase
MEQEGRLRPIADGLLFPEGPVAFPDGSVVLVELLRGTLTRCWGDGRTEVVCDLGGGPNGAAVGPDGAIYVCNSGGFDWSRGADGGFEVRGPLARERGGGGRIERVDLATGRSERIYETAAGHPLSAPNDIVFDAAGGFWFTDIGHEHARTKDRAGLYYAQPDGSRIDEVHFGAISYNGVGLSPGGSRLYVADSHTARLWDFEVEAPGRIRRPEGSYHPARLAGTAPEAAIFDSLAVTESGRVCVGTLLPGGISVFGPAGLESFHPLPDGYVTNLCFGGPERRTAYVTLSLTGQLVALDWPEPGLQLNFSPV